MPFVKKVAPTLDETDAPMADAPALEPETLAPAPPAVAVALGNEQRGAQRRAAIHRVLHMEQRTLLHVSGGKQLRRVLLARTLRALPSISDAFVEFMFDSFETRDGLEHILQWLYCLYVDTVANTKGHVYANALLTVIKRMLATLSPRDKALPTLLVEVPALPAPVFDLLTWLCGLSHDADGVPAPDMEQRTLGLVALRDVITNRPADRDSCLDLVLRCTTHQDDVLRGKAIRMVVNQLHPLLLDAANTIVEYATQQLNSANKLVADQDAADGDAGLTEAGLQRVSLFFALCTRVAELVPKLFVSYAACSQPVQAAFHKNMVRPFVPGPVMPHADTLKSCVPTSNRLACRGRLVLSRVPCLMQSRSLFLVPRRLHCKCCTYSATLRTPYRPCCWTPPGQRIHTRKTMCAFCCHASISCRETRFGGSCRRLWCYPQIMSWLACDASSLARLARLWDQ